jgi:maleate isomerase
MAHRIGIVLPSSNTVVEPLSASALLNKNATAHFSRLGVFDVTLDQASLAQFTMEKHLQAARLLADARVDRLVWGGTSASWLGIAQDEDWCTRMTNITGIPASTCVLEINRQLAERNTKRIALVTPYTGDVQACIIQNYTALGFQTVSEAHVGATISNDYAAIPSDTIAAMMRQVAAAQPEAIVVMCTNMHGAACAAAIEAQTGIPVIDSAKATYDAGLRGLTPP